MPKRGTPPIHDLLQGTLDVLILKTIALGPRMASRHRHAIERRP
jgi:hypothetical protein